MSDRDGVELLHAAIARDGGLLARDLTAAKPDPVFGLLAAAGPRARATSERYALVIESAFEGYLLHYSDARLLETGDEDLRLLGGDFLYALGLCELAALGDVGAIAQLASLISLCSQAHAGVAEPNPELIAALWSLTALAVGGGSWPAYGNAMAAVREERDGAAAIAAGCASQRASELGLELELERALIVFRGMSSSAARST